MSMSSEISARTSVWELPQQWWRQLGGLVNGANTGVDELFTHNTNSVDARTISASSKRDALHRRPGKGDTVLPEAVQQAEKLLHADYRQQVAAAQKYLNHLENESNRLTGRIKLLNVKGRADGIISDMVNALTHASDNKTKIRAYKKEFLSKQDDLDKFKIEHGLLYAPTRGIGKAGRFGLGGSIAVVVTLFIIESLINTTMLFAGSQIEASLALNVAFGVSLVNVVSGYFIGRYVIGLLSLYWQGPMRTLIWTSVAAFSVFLIGINFLFGVFRTATTPDISRTIGRAIFGATENSDAGQESAAQIVRMQEALGNLEWSLFGLTIDFYGIVLICIGLIFFTFAVVDGRFSDDPFPGYGRKYRICLRQKEIVAQHLRSYKRLFERRIATDRVRLDRLFIRSRGAIHEWGKNINAIQKTFVDYTDYADALRSHHQSSWQIYVASHEKHRLRGYEPPAILQNPPEFFVSAKRLDPAHVFRDVAHFHMDDKERIRQIDKFEDDLAKCQVEYQKAFSTSVQNLRKNLAELEKEAECPM